MTHPTDTATQDDAPTWYVPASEYAVTQSVRGRADALARSVCGFLAGTESDPAHGTVVVVASAHASGTAPEWLHYLCSLNGWRVLSDEAVAGEHRGRTYARRVRVAVDRTGAQVVEIDPVHGTGFAEGGYYGGPGAWGGYGVRDAAGPWYRYTQAGGLRPCPAGEAIADLTRRAKRICAADRDHLAEITSW